jgi:glycosyltransferase involved in cell wall biosynthesis
MKIAIFHNLPSGGAKRSISKITDILAQRHQIALFETIYSERAFYPIAQNEKIEHATVEDNNSWFRHSISTSQSSGMNWLLSILPIKHYYKFISERINRWEPDLVLVFPCRFHQTPYVLRFLKAPVVFVATEPPRYVYEQLAFWGRKKENGVFKRLTKNFKREIWKRLDQNNVSFATEIITISNYSQEYCYHVYQRISPVCHFGVDAAEYYPSEKISKEDLILSVGRLHPLKGHDFVIRSVAKINVLPKPRMVIVGDEGDSHEKKELESLASELGISLLIQIGVSHDELRAWYNRARVVACGQIMEPLGLIPLEAMACGTPVVAVKEGGLRETVPHGVGGLLVERNEELFADALSYFLTNQDANCEWGKRARNEVVNYWTWEKCCKKIEIILERVIKESVHKQSN